MDTPIDYHRRYTVVSARVKGLLTALELPAQPFIETTTAPGTQA